MMICPHTKQECQTPFVCEMEHPCDDLPPPTPSIEEIYALAGDVSLALSALLEAVKIVTKNGAQIAPGVSLQPDKTLSIGPAVTSFNVQPVSDTWGKPTFEQIERLVDENELCTATVCLVRTEGTPEAIATAAREYKIARAALMVAIKAAIKC